MNVFFSATLLLLLEEKKISSLFSFLYIFFTFFTLSLNKYSKFPTELSNQHVIYSTICFDLIFFMFCASAIIDCSSFGFVNFLIFIAYNCSSILCLALNITSMLFLNTLFFSGIISLKSFSNLVGNVESLFVFSLAIPSSLNILLFLFIIAFAEGNKAKSLFNSDNKSSVLFECSFIFIDFISFDNEVLINFKDSLCFVLGLK